MNDIIPFTYEDTPVRVLDRNGEPWFVLADLCKVLGISNPRMVAARLDDDMKGVSQADTPGGRQSMTIVSEPGMYDVVVRSDSPLAKPFRRWVTHEVLPAIRKTGSYAATPAPQLSGKELLAAAEHQLNAAIRRAQMQMELCQAAKGLIHPDHLEARARVVLAKGLGEHAVLDEATRPLYTADYLKGKNLSQKRTKSVAPMFGKRVKAAYMELHGVTPQRYPLTLPNGQTRDVYAYTEADRALMDRVWNEFYATQGVLA